MLGIPIALLNWVEDTTPQAGGPVDLNGNPIITLTNGDLVLSPDGTGAVRITSPNAIIYDTGSGRDFLWFTETNQDGRLKLISLNDGTLNQDKSVMSIVGTNGILQVDTGLFLTDDKTITQGAANDFTQQWDGENEVYNVTSGAHTFTGGPLTVNDKVKLTELGGHAVKLTNKTGGASVKGRLLEVYNTTAIDDAVMYNEAGGNHPIGVFLDDGVADGAEAWVVTFGPADVALDDDVAAVLGYWVGSGAEGYCAVSATPPGAFADHFKELGHCMQAVTAGGGGTHILTRCITHYN